MIAGGQQSASYVQDRDCEAQIPYDREQDILIECPDGGEGDSTLLARHEASAAGASSTRQPWKALFHGCKAYLSWFTDHIARL